MSGLATYETANEAFKVAENGSMNAMAAACRNASWNRPRDT